MQNWGQEETPFPARLWLGTAEIRLVSPETVKESILAIMEGKTEASG